KMNIKDTIAAIATPLGRGGIGIVRISGPGSRPIGESLFVSARPEFPGFASHVLHHGWVVDGEGARVDEVLLSFMPAPASYTGQDVVEINCHGGPAVVQTVLETVLNQGARLAGPGEFTLRAFVNGRMDLSQAEAVAEMVDSDSQIGMSMAGVKLEGRLKEVIIQLRDGLQDLLASIMAEMDFPEETEAEENEEDRYRRVLASGLKSTQETVGKLLEAAKRYRCYREGALVVLAGRVNAGKSSLLNALLGRNRAIVTPIPGTTRDYLEEGINLNGLPIRLVDTAGLRQTQDEVERAGLEQGEDLMLRADLVCLVFDHSQELDQEVREAALRLGPDKVLAVANKQDLPQARDRPEDWLARQGFAWIGVSASTGQGMDSLVQAIRDRIVGRAPEPSGHELVPNLRQRDLLDRVMKSLDEASQALDSGMPADVILVPVQDAVSGLGEITGEVSTEDILERIFSKFCIGK
ncbi:MAG: tRNA uridine-5-carboxymethylaminomethyl(34) synthesis GTPase MnmE, partial [Desulfovermiculus sp.]